MSPPVLTRDGNRVIITSGPTDRIPAPRWVQPFWVMLALAAGLLPALYDRANLTGYILVGGLLALFVNSLIVNVLRSTTVVTDPGNRAVFITRVRRFIDRVDRVDIPFDDIETIGLETASDTEGGVSHSAVLRRKNKDVEYLATSASDRFLIADIVFAICDTTKLQRRDREA